MSGAPTPVLALLGTALLALLLAIPLAGAGASAARQRRVGAWLGGAALVHLAGIAWWWVRVGHGPFIDRFEVLSSNAWALLAVFLVAAGLDPTLRDHARPVLATAAIQLAAALLVGPGARSLPPVMDSPWLTAHAVASKVALAAAVVALALALALWRGTGSTQALEEAQHRWSGYAFAAWTAGMLLGSVWGYHAFGVFWHWDTVELAALAGWAALGTYLHGLRLFRPPARARAALYLATFTVLVLSLYVAPMVRSGFHGGSFVK
jgi:ABC-type transport system involved in cytochrome c biogenesis permease subunit